jgi:HK97 family phage prohead protease
METKNNYNKISAEISEKIFSYLNEQKTQEFIAKMKDAGDDCGTFEVIISTADQDRQGEVIDQKGWDLGHYKNNPVVLWGHNYTDLPIGITDSIEVRDGKLVAIGRFAPESANPFAQQVRRLYDAKILRTTSVGFIAREMDGKTITKAELLEFSFVPVPANPMALSLMREINIESMDVIQKGLLYEEKAEKENKPGDICTTDDGEDGIYQDQDGTLVCVPVSENEPEEKGIKIGRTLSEKSLGQIEAAIVGIKSSLLALEELKKSVDLGGEDAGIPESDDAETRSNAQENDAQKGFKDWSREREFLRVINNVTSESLRKYNEKTSS